MLNQLIEQRAKSDKYSNLLDSLLDNVHIQGILHMQDALLYRSRWNDSGRLFQYTSEMSYPVANANWTFGKGRLNEAGQSVLYAARCELGTIIEMRAKLEKIFTTVSIKAKTPNLMFMPLGVLDRDFTMQPRNKAELAIRNFLYSEISKWVEPGDSESYNATIAIGKMFLGRRITGQYVNTLSHPAIAGVIYPSVEGKKTSNVTTYNYAIDPHIFDQHFEILDAKVYCMTLEPTVIRLHELNKSVKVSEGKIDWLLSFEEMKKRMSMGVSLEGNFNDLIPLGLSI